ncbi:hypothetical protein, partial [Neisseria meningitidis]|uniref:hypothetical protein n=1 Tax=Neisseria meningitidis TaxID=487 RepID=UPI00197FE9B7
LFLQRSQIAVFPTNSRHLKSRYPYKNRKSCHSHKNRNSKTEIPNPRHSRQTPVIPAFAEMPAFGLLSL